MMAAAAASIMMAAASSISPAAVGLPCPPVSVDWLDVLPLCCR